MRAVSTVRWGEALAALQERLGEDPREYLARVELARDGSLVFTEDSLQRPRWWRFGAGGLSESLPAEDGALALSARVGGTPPAGVLSYRPGRNLVLRVVGAGGRAEVLKGYRAGRAGPALARHLQARSALDAGTVVAADLDADFPDTLRMPAEEGWPPALDTSTAEVFFSIGEALGRLQAARPEGLGDHGRGDELALLVERRERTRGADLELPPHWERAFARLAARAEGIPTAARVFAHRDLHDGQFLVRSGRALWLDFDLAARAEPELDPANLLAHLRLRVLQKLRGATEAATDLLGDALLEGWGFGEGSDAWSRLRWYQASSFLRLALVYRLRPRWTPWTAHLVTLAERCLDET